jgi:hypothetical protein
MRQFMRQVTGLPPGAVRIVVDDYAARPAEDRNRLESGLIGPREVPAHRRGIAP